MLSRNKSLVIVVTGLLLAAVLAGCAGKAAAPATAPAPTGQPAAQGPAVKLKLGLLPIIDALPFYVAQEKGYFKEAGLDVELIPTASATERDQAFIAGAIDGGVTDSVGAALLINGGGDAKVISLSLGATPQEGRFALLLSPKSKITKPEELKGVPIGVSSNSVIEWVTEQMLVGQGLKVSDLKYSEVPKIPVRMQMLANGQLEAATLPDPLISLAVQQGARVLLDDSQGKNLTQSVIFLRGKLIAENPDAVKGLLAAYAKAVQDINRDHATYRQFMVDKKLLPEPLKDSFEFSDFPLPQLPKDADYTPVLDWLKARKVIKEDLTFDKIVAPGLTGN
ncbi:MAG: ABC transporter substrate-binding protein [Bacillota bacterium]